MRFKEKSKKLKKLVKDLGTFLDEGDFTEEKKKKAKESLDELRGMVLMFPESTGGCDDDDPVWPDPKS